MSLRLTAPSGGGVTEVGRSPTLPAARVAIMATVAMVATPNAKKLLRLLRRRWEGASSGLVLYTRCKRVRDVDAAGAKRRNTRTDVPRPAWWYKWVQADLIPNQTMPRSTSSGSQLLALIGDLFEVVILLKPQHIAYTHSNMNDCLIPLG